MQFSGSSLPAEPQRRQVLRDMSAQAICARMLANLCNLACSCLFQPEPVHTIHSNLRLTDALIQLLPRYCKGLPPRVVTGLLEQEQHCRSNLVRLYADLLIKGGFEVGGTNHHLCRTSRVRKFCTYLIAAGCPLCM